MEIAPEEPQSSCCAAQPEERRNESSDIWGAWAFENLCDLQVRAPASRKV